MPIYFVEISTTATQPPAPLRRRRYHRYRLRPSYRRPRIPGKVYGRINSIGRFTTKSDIIAMMGDSNLALKDIKFDYNITFNGNTALVETHIFSFVVGRAFVTDIEKLKLSSKATSLEVERVLGFFSEITKDGINPGANLLYAVEVLVSGVYTCAFSISIS
nr:protein SPIRRIG [Ipomoea batatas]